MTLVLEITGLIMAVVDIYFPTARDAIEAFMDRQAELSPKRIRPLKRLGLIGLGVSTIGIAVSFLVIKVYEPDLGPMPPINNIGDLISVSLGRAIGSMVIVLLVTSIVFLFTLLVLGIVALVALPYAIAPFASALNKLTRGHAYGAIGLLIALIGFGIRFI